MEPTEDHYLEVAAAVDQLHIVFTNLFPDECVVKVNVPRCLVSTPDFVEIRRWVRAVRNWFERYSSSRELLLQPWRDLWKETQRLTDRVAMAGRYGPSDEINRAFRLFFATSALTYVWLREQSEAVARRETGGYIDENQVVVAQRSAFAELRDGTLLDAVRWVAEAEREVLPALIRRRSRCELGLTDRTPTGGNAVRGDSLPK